MKKNLNPDSLPRALLMPCPTQWNSDYYMVSRLLQEKQAVSAEISTNSNVENLTSAEWKLAQGYEAILEPFAEACTALCGEKYPSLVLKIPVLFSLNAFLQTFVDNPLNRDCSIMMARELQ